MNSPFINKIKTYTAGVCLGLIFIFLPALSPAQGIMVLNPGKFLYTSNDSCNISGTEPFKNSPAISFGDTTSIIQLKYYSPNGYDYNLIDRVKNSVIKMGALKDGTYVIILHKKNEPLILKEDEVKNFITEFKPANAADLLAAASGRSLTLNLQENIKTIIQSGTYFTENCSSPTTLPLDIVPDKNLYNSKKSLKKFILPCFLKEHLFQKAISPLYIKKMMILCRSFSW